MWYFTWILGVSFAACCGVINVLWLEQDDRFDEEPEAQQSSTQE